MRRVLGLAIVVTFVAATFAQAEVPVTWDGGDGVWSSANWNGGQTVKTLVGNWNGSNGYKDPNGGSRFVIDGPVTVTYDANATEPDNPGSLIENLVIKQGSSMTIKNGATWQQVQNDTFLETYWTLMDGSQLYLDNGTMKKVGLVASAGGSGGVTALGTWKGDDNFDVVPGPQVIDVVITNGGRFENQGQLWFGAEDDNSEGLIAGITINDGDIDLSGGEVPDGDYGLVEDLGFYAVNYLGAVPEDDQNVDYSINFGGPGTIVTDNGIYAVTKDVPDGQGPGAQPWVNTLDGSQVLAQVTYQDLWDIGYLQAYGKSGLDGETFSDFFVVSGTPGGDDYTLTSLVAQIAGDVNLDGEVNGLDVAPFVDLVVGGDKEWAQADINGDGEVNGLDVVGFVDLVVGGGPAAQGVPEPSTMLLAGLGLLGLALAARRRR